MFAIVEACGRQYQVEAGRFINIDLTEADKGDTFVFDKVLMLVDGDKSTVGAPYVDGAKVSCRILSHMKGKKIIVYYQRPKKGTRKKNGHRQHFTRVFIDSISLKDQVLAKADESKTRKSEDKEEKAPKASAKAAPKKSAKTEAKGGEKPKAAKAKDTKK